jgi:hypothetical protein
MKLVGTMQLLGCKFKQRSGMVQEVQEVDAVRCERLALGQA